MNKIYNNLNIENLTKIEWFNQFDIFQKNEISKGLESKVDVSIYANPIFKEEQMRELREGLEENLDVSKYANPDFGWAEMYAIREA